MDNKIGITLDGEKDANGEFIKGTVSLSFDNQQIAKFLKEWADTKSHFNNYKASVYEHTEIEQSPILEHITKLEKS